MLGIDSACFPLSNEMNWHSPACDQSGVLGVIVSFSVVGGFHSFKYEQFYSA